MKRLFLITLFAVSAMALVSCDDHDKAITPDQLPAKVQSFIKSHFPSCEVIYAYADREYKGVSYDVKLDCMVDLEFDDNGVWEKIDCNPNQVPDKVIPQTILNYVHTNYPKYFIMEIDRDRRDYEVELNVGLDLVFDLDGNFVRVDN